MSKPARVNEPSRSYRQAEIQIDCITEMVAALNCDYERLAELREERQGIKDEELIEWDAEHGEELAALGKAANGSESREDAERCIQEDPLSVEVRSDWRVPGSDPEPPSGYQILLCTGGPAARIIGTLDRYGEPSTACIEHQDWGTPWTDYPLTGEQEEIVLQYASCFYFGE